MLKQNALVLQTYKEKKFALLMSKKEPSPPLVVPAVPPLADTMSSRRKPRKVSILKISMPNPCRPDNTSCTFGSSEKKKLPRKVSFTCQARNSKLGKTDTPTAALVPNDYSTGSSRGPSICSTIEATLDQQDPLFNNEFMISNDDCFFDDDEDLLDLSREGNSPHVEMFKSQFFPLDF